MACNNQCCCQLPSPRLEVAASQKTSGYLSLPLARALRQALVTLLKLRVAHLIAQDQVCDTPTPVMSVLRYRSEAERLQIEQDHQFVWAVINKDEKVLSKLPPGPAAPQKFLHFLQQGDISDEALAAFDPEALQIVQSPRRKMEEKSCVDLSAWHAEWVGGEQQRKTWVAPGSSGTSQSLLMQPADIDLATHDMAAQRVALHYWGEDSEMPAGCQEQQERWAKEAKEATHQGNAHARAAATPTAVSQYEATREDLLQSIEEELRKMQETVQKHGKTEQDEGDRGFRPGF